jgi:sigma-B regulation protein RsbU (phosphoserine phosphatase)
VTAGKFVTLFYGVLDAASGALHYTNAGHLLPILIGGDGTVRELGNGGALLGVFPDWRYEDSVVYLRPGDRLLLFTDGITEAALPGKEEEFGEQRLIACAQANAGKPTAEFKSLLLDEVKQFCASQLGDDATLIVVSALATVAVSAREGSHTCAVV